MNNFEATQIILDAGFHGGWVLHGAELVLWEHDEDPPLPLIRPDQPIVEETPVADETLVVDESVVE